MAIFFFSSRRRHTRSKRDWSSDVCSSDLDGVVASHGLLVINKSIVSDRVRFGVSVDGDAHLDATQLEITNCGSATAGGGMVLHTSGSTISGCSDRKSVV